MTHAQALAGNRTGPLPMPTICNGRLVHHDSFDDHHLINEGPVSLRVTMYRCVACKCRVVIERVIEPDRTVQLVWMVTSDFMPLGATHMIRALAGKLTLDR